MKTGLKAIALVSAGTVFVGVVVLCVLGTLEQIVDRIEIMLETTNHNYGNEEFDEYDDICCGCGCDIGE